MKHRLWDNIYYTIYINFSIQSNEHNDIKWIWMHSYICIFWCIYIYSTQCMGMVNKYRVVILRGKWDHSGSSTLSLIFHSLKSACSKYGKKFKI